jgi:hypothetical protein
MKPIVTTLIVFCSPRRETSSVPIRRSQSSLTFCSVPAFKPFVCHVGIDGLLEAAGPREASAYSERRRSLTVLPVRPSRVGRS